MSCIRIRALAAAALCVAVAVSARAQEFSPWSAAVRVANVNSASLDGCPAISRDGLSLYFASTRNGGQLDIYVAQRDSRIDEFGAASPVGAAINEPGSDEFCPSLSPDSHLLFFASSRAGGCGGIDIYVSRRQNKRDDFGWEAPQNLGCRVNSAADDFGPNYFETEDGVPSVYFNSNRPGGAGQQDLYRTSIADDGAFEAAVPVVELNTPYNDQQTAVRRDGLEVIFTSNRPGGAGLADLWRATREHTWDLWSTPELVPNVNSTAADARPALSWDGEELYFGSTRGGNSDIYRAVREKNPRD